MFRERVRLGQCLGMGGTEFVVRERQVTAATLYVETESELVQCDDAALDVPARAPGAEFGLPTGFTGSRHTPEQGVHRIALARTVGVTAPFTEQRRHRRGIVVRLVSEASRDVVV